MLTPEEWVRQNFCMFLVEEKKYPSSLMALEAAMKLYAKTKRTDILIYGRSRKPLAIVECKAPDVRINQQVFDQIVRYNMAFQVNFLMVTNGLQHLCCRLNYADNSYSFLPDIPEYNFILT
jgi:type I site-specific restriction endonuclease